MRHAIGAINFRQPTFDNTAADKPLKSGPGDSATRPDIWPGATLLVDCRRCNPDEPDRPGPFLDDAGYAERLPGE
jgi:hypothetical protein